MLRGMSTIFFIKKSEPFEDSAFEPGKVRHHLCNAINTIHLTSSPSRGSTTRKQSVPVKVLRPNELFIQSPIDADLINNIKPACNRILQNWLIPRCFVRNVIIGRSVGGNCYLMRLNNEIHITV